MSVYRRPPFVGDDGALTLYGWSVLEELSGGGLGVGPVTLGFGAGSKRSIAFGCISVADGSTSEATTDATPRKIAAWAANGLSQNMINDHTSDDVEVLHEGVYDVTLACSFSGSNSKHYHIEIYVDSAGSGIITDLSLGAGGDEGSCSASGFLRLAAGEKVSVYHWSPDGGSTFTMTQGTLTLNRIGD